MMSTKKVSLTVLCDGKCINHQQDQSHPLIEASIYVKIPGLAFHEAIRNESDSWGLWAVTHVKSGYRIGHLFNTRRRCMKYIKEIKSLIDWTKGEKSVKASYKKLNDHDKAIILSY